jgi:tRNA A37 threonylcarbamoyladenosine modification protein TsaB
MLSIFVNGHKYFVSSEKYAEEILGLENVVSVIQKIMSKNENKVVFSAGPDTFTSMRVIGSIVKGISLCAPQMTFLSISNFLTLFSLVPNDIDSGTIAIDTMRGDFYCMDFTGILLNGYRLIREEELSSNNGYVLYNNKIRDKNLAISQIETLKNEKFKANMHLISKSIGINYGNTPQYKY